MDSNGIKIQCKYTLLDLVQLHIALMHAHFAKPQRLGILVEFFRMEKLHQFSFNHFQSLKLYHAWFGLQSFVLLAANVKVENMVICELKLSNKCQQILAEIFQCELQR